MTTDALPPRPSPAFCRPVFRGKHLLLLLPLLSGSLALPAAATPATVEQAAVEQHAASPLQGVAAAAAAEIALAAPVAERMDPADAPATATAEQPAVASAAAPAGPAAADGLVSAHPSPGPAPVQAPSGGLGGKAAGAVSATLAALLPRLAANDTLPLLDRSVLLAGDLSRLLQYYQGGPAQAEDAGAAGDDMTGKVRSLLERATALLGTPYRWGGTSPDSGFDCSGLVSYVFRSALGIELPRISRDMARSADAALIKNLEDLQQGDLVFFGRRGRVDHVGIYVGDGRFLHAPSRGKDVRVDSMTGGYWGAKFMQARRVAM